MYRTFGCQAMVLTPAGERGSKAAPVSKRMVHIRHDMQAKGYRFYDPASQRIVVSRDCYFLEMTAGGELMSGPGGGAFPHLEPEEVPEEGTGDGQRESGTPQEEEESENSVYPPGGRPHVHPRGQWQPKEVHPQEHPMEGEGVAEEAPQAPPRADHQCREAEGEGVPVVHHSADKASPPERGPQRRGDQGEEPPVPAPGQGPAPFQPYVLALPHRAGSHGWRQPNRDCSPARTRSRAREEIGQQVTTQEIPNAPLPSTMRIPENYEEARQSEWSGEWAAAEAEEIRTMLENEVWGEPVPLPPGKTVVGSKWVYDIKYKGTGEVERLKARFCAQGCSQREGRDYHHDSLHAPVVRQESIKVLTHIGARNGWIFRLMDVKGAYLASPIREEVYIRQPKGYEDPRNPTGVLQLKRALYGLKQSARAWYGRLSSFLISQGFEVNAIDPSLFQRTRGDRIMFVEVYVDDLGALANSEEEMEEFQKAMSSEFKMKDLGETSYYLGIHFEHHKNSKTIHLHQNLYIQHLLDRYNLLHAKKAPTPLEEGHTLTLEEA